MCFIHVPCCFSYRVFLVFSALAMCTAQPPEASGEPNFGSAVTIHVDGYFHPVIDPAGTEFRAILAVRSINILERFRKA